MDMDMVKELLWASEVELELTILVALNGSVFDVRLDEEDVVLSECLRSNGFMIIILVFTASQLESKLL
jgi:hypothetical protein